MKNDKEYLDMPGVEESQPQISLILPFDIKMNQEKALIDLLTKPANKIEKELRLTN